MSRDELVLQHSVELTCLGHTAQLVNSPIVEQESCAGGEVSHGAGDEHLVRLRQPADARSQMDRDSPNARAVDLSLTRLNAANTKVVVSP